MKSGNNTPVGRLRYLLIRPGCFAISAFTRLRTKYLITRRRREACPASLVNKRHELFGEHPQSPGRLATALALRQRSRAPGLERFTCRCDGFIELFHATLASGTLAMVSLVAGLYASNVLSAPTDLPSAMVDQTTHQ